MQRIISCALLLILSTGCQNRDSSRSASQAPRDSAGVKITEVDLRSLRPADRCTYSEPKLRIGTLDADPVYELGEVSSATRLSNGDIALVNRSTKEVRIFKEDGTFLRTLGREGQGPGEFTDPITLVALPGDTLVVWDLNSERLTTFGPEGNLVRTASLTPPILNALDWLYPHPSSDRFLMGSTKVNTPEGTELVADSSVVLEVGLDGQVRDTLAILHQSRGGWVDQSISFAGSPIFDHTSTISTSRDRIYVSRGDAPQIEVRDASWKLTRVIRWQEGDRHVTKADLDAYKARRLARETNAKWKAMIELGWRKIPPAESFPTADQLVGDVEGGVWARRVRRSAEVARTWWGFSAEGAFVCALTLPEGFDALEFRGSEVLGVLEDSTGMHQVQVITFQSSASRR